MKLNVVYSTDENYAQHAIVSIASLLKSNIGFEEINIYIIDNNISNESKQKIKNLVELNNRHIKFIPINEVCTNLNKKDDFPISAYARLFISRFIKEDKVLYLDCDTVIDKSLKELWDIDLSGYYIGGVQDTAAQYLVKAIDMSQEDRYLNSGVLLINLKLWREINLEDKFISFIDKHSGRVPHHDQGIINGVCKGNILILDPKYNVMPEMFYFKTNQIKKLYHLNKYYSDEELNNIQDTAVIIHYISKFYNRPWYKNCNHPLKEKYKEFLLQQFPSIKLENSSNDTGLNIRMKIFKYFPFYIYNIFEQILYTKRLIHSKFLYSSRR